MRKFEDLNHYEIFEIPVNASNFEIRQAYREALSIYGADSAISYSFFTEEEREDILGRVEEAFSTLIDENRREQYDKTLVDEKKIDPSALKKKRQKVPTPIFSFRGPDGKAISKTIKNGIKEEDLKKTVDEILLKDMISGNDLKMLRKAVGVTIQDLFEGTRISVSSLEAIENDNLDALPSAVYLRNFLKTYAELFKVDPEKIIDRYIKNLDHIRGAS